MLPYLRHLYIVTLFCAVPGMTQASWPLASLKKTWVKILPTAKFSRKQKICFGSLAALGVGTLGVWCYQKYLSSNDRAAMQKKIQHLQERLDNSFESDPTKVAENNAYVVSCEQISIMRGEAQGLKCVACLSAGNWKRHDAALLEGPEDTLLPFCCMTYEFVTDDRSEWFKRCQDRIKKALANDLQGSSERAINKGVQVLRRHTNQVSVRAILKIMKNNLMSLKFLPRVELSETDPYEIVIKLVPDPNASQGIEMLRVKFDNISG